MGGEFSRSRRTYLGGSLRGGRQPFQHFREVSFSVFFFTAESAQTQPRKVCEYGIAVPSEASLQSVLGAFVPSQVHVVRRGNSPIYTAQYSEHVRVALVTLGDVEATKAELASVCKKGASVMVPYPALLTQTLEPCSGSAHKVSLCHSLSARNSMPGEAAAEHLVARLFQSASQANIERILRSSSHYVLSHSTWAQSPTEVDGVLRSDWSPVIYSCFQDFSLHHVAVCTGWAEKVQSTKRPTLDDLLDPSNQQVINCIRNAVFQVLQYIERHGSMERAIHLAANIAVPDVIPSPEDGVNPKKPKRMLPIPKDDDALKTNQEFLSGFFLQHVLRCLNTQSEIKKFALRLIGKNRFAVAVKNAERESNEELIYQVFLQWKKATGRDIDFVALKDVFGKMGHKELQDLCEMYVSEHAFHFKMHQITCPCFVE